MGELTYNCASLPEGTASATQRGVDLTPEVYTHRNAQ